MGCRRPAWYLRRGRFAPSERTPARKMPRGARTRSPGPRGPSQTQVVWGVLRGEVGRARIGTGLADQWSHVAGIPGEPPTPRPHPQGDDDDDDDYDDSEFDERADVAGIPGEPPTRRVPRRRYRQRRICPQWADTRCGTVRIRASTPDRSFVRIIYVRRLGLRD